MSAAVAYVTQDTRHIITNWREDLANLIPHAKEITYQGDRMLVLPNRHDEARVARNVGVAIPPPILTSYDWNNTKPWEAQRVTAAMLADNPRCYVLSDMGTGKTRSVLYAADYLMRAGLARRMLVVAPLSTLTPVWERELFQLMLKRRVRVLYGSREKRIKQLAEDADIYIINHHGLSVVLPELTAKGFDIIVLDELATFRTKRTNLWSAATTVVNAPTTKYAWGLTGSPTPNAPTDAWAQVRLLTPERTTRTFKSFEDLTMRRVSQFRLVTRPGANEVVRDIMQPSVRFTRDDIQELPMTSYVDREVQLDADIAKLYKLMAGRLRALTAKGEGITAVNEGVLQNKLLQIACGYVYTDTKTVHTLPATGRLAALQEAIDETSRKVLVMVPFLHALDGVASHLRSKHYDVAVVHGGTSRTARDKIFTSFQTGSSPRIICAHPQTLAHGLTLTEANVIVWYSPTTSHEIYDQACARITRPGQTSKTLIVHLAGTLVEKLTYKRLRERGRMQNILLDMFTQQELDL